MSASEGKRTELADHSYAGTTATLNQARGDVADLLQLHDLVHLIANAQLIVSELTSNAVDASPGSPYRVAILVGSGQLTIAVSNRSFAELPPAQKWKPTDVLAPQGRGLSIVDALSSSVAVNSSGGEITVSACLDIVPA